MPNPAIEPGTLHVSFSQLNTYLLCPERFKQAYVRARTPSHRSGDLVFGSAIHEALAWYHERLLEDASTRPSAVDLTHAFDEAFAADAGRAVPVLWSDQGGPDELTSKGHSLLTLYRDTQSPHRILAVEKPFVLPRLDPRSGAEEEETLTGVVNLVEQESDGTVWVTEFKTAARRFDEARLRFDHQMSVYAAARTALGFPDAKLRFRVLLKTKKPAIETYEVGRDEGQIAETGLVVDQVLRAIDAGIFYPTRGWQCTNCPYRAACGS